MPRYIILRRSDDIELEAVRTASSSAPRLELGDLRDEGEATELRRDPAIEFVVPDIPVDKIAPIPTSSPSSEARDGDAAWGIAATDAARPDLDVDGSGVRVAVLDSGIDRDHAAFTGLNIEERDYTGTGDGDTDGHGTHVAATIFGQDVGGVRIGVARGVRDVFIGKVVGGSAGSGAVANAIVDAARAGCQVINLSLGFQFPRLVQRFVALGYPRDLAAARALYDYRQNVRLFDRLGQYVEAISNKVMLIAASGNDSKRDDHPPYELPASPPAESDGFISVGALRRTPGGLTVTSFSNAGVHVCAPGENVLSAQAGTTDGLVALDGTSMAAPHVSGLAALALEAWGREPIDIGTMFAAAIPNRDRLVATASMEGLSPGQRAARVGAGIPRLR